VQDEYDIQSGRAAGEPAFAGLHLAGPNANKTALVVLRGRPGVGPLAIDAVYDRIGTYGGLFSDERLVEILTRTGPFAQVFVDCPLTVPPCVSCQRPVCPGAVQCEDVSVAYMLKVSSAVRRRGARKARPVNPQSQRLWDVLQLESPRGERLEPSYSANLAPLVTRARTLQRRLNALDPTIELQETSIVNTLERMAAALKLSPAMKLSYRNFEEGLERRRQIVQRMVDRGWLHEDEELTEAGAATVETFHALIAAWVGALRQVGLTGKKPKGFIAGEGWVHLPELSEPVSFKRPVFE
jgi:hypothetical protein